jgi:hypothetical protein
MAFGTFVLPIGHDWPPWIAGPRPPISLRDGPPKEEEVKTQAGTNFIACHFRLVRITYSFFGVGLKFYPDVGQFLGATIWLCDLKRTNQG